MISIFYFFMLLFTLMLVPDKYSAFSKSYNFNLGLIYFLLIAVFFLYQRRKEKNWLRFDVMFIIGYTIVHFQIPFLASLGVEPSRPAFIWLNKDVVNYATWLSLLGITLWMFAYTIVKQPEGRVPPYFSNKVRVGLADKLLAFLFIGFLLNAGSNFLGGAYNVNSWGGAANYFLTLFKTVLYLRIIYFFQKLSNNTAFKVILAKALSNKLFITILITYSLLFFATGSRGEILRVLLVVAFSYSIFLKPLSFRFILIAILIGSFVFTVMGMGRGRVAAELGDQGLLQRGYANFIEMEEKKLPTEELASSVRILYRAIDVIPHSHDYLYGVPYAITLISPIPFSASLLVKTFDIPYQYQATSRLFTYLGQGNHITYGEGSEVLADMYANFGFLGIVMLMLIFGFLSAKVNQKSKLGSFNYTLVYVVILITALSMNRGTVFYAYKEIFYIVMFHLIFSGKLKWKK